MASDGGNPGDSSTPTTAAQQLAASGRAPWTLAPAYQGAVPYTQQFAGNPYMYANGFDQAADLFKISGILPGAPGNPMLNNRTARYDFKRTGDVPGIGQAPYLAPWAQSPLGTDNHNSGPGYIPAVNPTLWGGTPGSGSTGQTPTPPWIPPPTPTNTNPSGAGGPIGGSPIKGGEVPGIVKTGAPTSPFVDTQQGNIGAVNNATPQWFQNAQIPPWAQSTAAALAQNPRVQGYQDHVTDPVATFNQQGNDVAKYTWLNNHPQYMNQVRAALGPTFASWYNQTAYNGGDHA